MVKSHTILSIYVEQSCAMGKIQIVGSENLGSNPLAAMLNLGQFVHDTLLLYTQIKKFSFFISEIKMFLFACAFLGFHLRLHVDFFSTDRGIARRKYMWKH